MGSPHQMPPQTCKTKTKNIMKKLFLLLSVLALSLVTNATIPNLTKATPLTLTATSDGFTQSDNAEALIDGEWINWPGITIHEGYAKWRVNVVDAGTYSVTIDMKCANTYMYRAVVINPTTGDTIAVGRSEKNDRHTKVDDVVIPYENTAMECGSFRLIGIEPGEYVIAVSDTIKWSNGQLRGVTLTYAGGTTVAIPTNDLVPADAILSPRAWIDNDSILFTPRGAEGYNEVEYAKWCISVETGAYSFTVHAHDAYANNGQDYTVKIYNLDETKLIDTQSSGYKSTGACTYTTGSVFLKEGKYIVRVNNYNYSKGRVLRISSTCVGGHSVTIPAVSLSFAEAFLSANATRSTSPAEIHFGSPNVSQWAKWYVHADEGGLYDITINFTGTDYGIYQLDVTDEDGNSLFSEMKGHSNSGSETFSSIFLPYAGYYFIKLANINSGSNGYLTSVVVAAGAEENVFIIDENETDASIIAGLSEVSKKTILNRTFAGGMYNTLCIPVEPGSSELKNAFGEGYELLEMESAVMEEGGILVLNFTTVSSFLAGKPYLIKPVADVKYPRINAHKIHNYTSNNTTHGTAADFIGSFVKTSVPAGENNLFLGSGNKLYFSSEATPIKGMRAYFEVDPSAGAPARARIVANEQVVTDVELLNGKLPETFGSSKVGKFINNGQLIIVKDGVYYNAFGIKVK